MTASAAPRRSVLQPHTVRVLRVAGVVIRSAPADDRLRIFDACRVALDQLTGADSFYVAMVRTSTRHVLHPYTYDHGKAVAVNVAPYGDRGLTAWMLASQRTYRYRDDNGAIVHAGRSFGRSDEVSRDAIAVPFLDPTVPADRRVSGFMTLLSNTADTFTDEHVAAMEWLGRAVSARWRRDADHRDEGSAPFPLIDVRQPVDAWDVINYSAVALRRLQEDLQNLATLHPDASAALLGLADRCGHVHGGLQQMTARSEQDDDPFRGLTAREREIAFLLADEPQLSNAEVARRLGITEATTKTHVSRMLAKLSLRQRSEIAWTARHRRSQISRRA